MMQNVPVTKFMATKLITFTPDLDVREAMKTILKNKISGAPVLDAQDNLVGMLSEKDCIQLIVDGMYNTRPGGKGTVGEFMTRSLTTIDASKTIMDAALVFTSTPIRRLPVVQNGKLIGQISRRDILTAIVKIKPEVKIVPDSWRGREPALEPSKQGHHTEHT